jgi:hypothetical protein
MSLRRRGISGSLSESEESELFGKDNVKVSGFESQSKAKAFKIRWTVGLPGHANSDCLKLI